MGALYRWREARLRGAHAREREQAERRLEARLEAGERAEEELGRAQRREKDAQKELALARVETQALARELGELRANAGRDLAKDAAKLKSEKANLLRLNKRLMEELAGQDDKIIQLVSATNTDRLKWERDEAIAMQQKLLAELADKDREVQEVLLQLKADTALHVSNERNMRVTAEAELISLSNSMTDSSELKGQVASLTEVNASLVKSQEVLQGQLAEATKVLADLKGKKSVEKLMAKMQDVRSQVLPGGYGQPGSLKGKKPPPSAAEAELKAKLRDRAAELKQLKGQLRRAEEAAAQKEASLSGLRGEVKELRKARAQMLQDKKETSKGAREAKLNGQISELDASVADLTGKLRESQDAAARKDGAVASLQDEVKQLRKRLDFKELEISRLSVEATRSDAATPRGDPSAAAMESPIPTTSPFRRKDLAESQEASVSGLPPQPLAQMKLVARSQQEALSSAKKVARFAEQLYAARGRLALSRALSAWQLHFVHTTLQGRLAAARAKATEDKVDLRAEIANLNAKVAALEKALEARGRELRARDEEAAHLEERLRAEQAATVRAAEASLEAGAAAAAAAAARRPAEAVEDDLKTPQRVRDRPPPELPGGQSWLAVEAERRPAAGAAGEPAPEPALSRPLSAVLGEEADTVLTQADGLAALKETVKRTGGKVQFREKAAPAAAPKKKSKIQKAVEKRGPGAYRNVRSSGYGVGAKKPAKGPAAKKEAKSKASRSTNPNIGTTFQKGKLSEKSPKGKGPAVAGKWKAAVDRMPPSPRRFKNAQTMNAESLADICDKMVASLSKVQTRLQVEVKKSSNPVSDAKLGDLVTKLKEAQRRALEGAENMGSAAASPSYRPPADPLGIGGAPSPAPGGVHGGAATLRSPTTNPLHNRKVAVVVPSPGTAERGRPAGGGGQPGTSNAGGTRRRL